MGDGNKTAREQEVLGQSRLGDILNEVGDVDGAVLWMALYVLISILNLISWDSRSQLMVWQKESAATEKTDGVIAYVKGWLVRRELQQSRRKITRE